MIDQSPGQHLSQSLGQSPGRAPARRLQEILGIVREVGRVSVDDLAARFAVTPQTIRRDLNELCDSRRLTRVHGGAMLASGVENLAYDDRKLVSQPHKRLIGEAAARLVANDSSLFIWAPRPRKSRGHFRPTPGCW
jgi:DeoR family glycerol-3-phosphate regulon repressor